MDIFLKIKYRGEYRWLFNYKRPKIDLGKTSPGLTKAVIGLDGILNLMTAEPISI